MLERIESEKPKWRIVKQEDGQRLESLQVGPRVAMEQFWKVFHGYSTPMTLPWAARDSATSTPYCYLRGRPERGQDNVFFS
jgi:hypothetical protein